MKGASVTALRERALFSASVEDLKGLLRLHDAVLRMLSSSAQPSASLPIAPTTQLIGVPPLPLPPPPGTEGCPLCQWCKQLRQKPADAAGATAPELRAAAAGLIGCSRESRRRSMSARLVRWIKFSGAMARLKGRQILVAIHRRCSAPVARWRIAAIASGSGLGEAQADSNGSRGGSNRKGAAR